MDGIAGRVAVVTGGTRGLGRVIVDGLAKAGATVVIASRHADACEEVANAVARDTGVVTMAHPVHMGRWSEIDTLVDAVYSRFGAIDIVVNNAGIAPRYGDLAMLTEELFDKILAVDLTGPFRLAAYAGIRMKSAGHGSIINVSSVAATRPRPDILPYAAAKAGLNAMTVGLAQALGPEVRCNAVAAGRFRTDAAVARNASSPASRPHATALQREGEPNEIVGTVLYLASDASSYTSGAVLAVDGGQH